MRLHATVEVIMTTESDYGTYHKKVPWHRKVGREATDLDVFSWKSFRVHQTAAWA